MLPGMDDQALAALRREYGGRPLEAEGLPSDPIEALRTWLDEAVAAQVADATAMTLATVDADGRPDARVVLLKGTDGGKLSFFTNYGSTKGAQLAGQPEAALCFFWPELSRQLRVRGTVEKVSAEVSDAYFASRPHGSQIGALASAQSEVLGSRAELEARVAELEAKYPKVVPRPEHWGGYALTPDELELWQGRPSRLHDRLRATLVDGAWGWARLSP